MKREPIGAAVRASVVEDIDKDRTGTASGSPERCGIPKTHESRFPEPWCGSDRLEYRSSRISEAKRTPLLRPFVAKSPFLRLLACKCGLTEMVRDRYGPFQDGR